MISRILVSGVSGPIGAALLPSLDTLGYKVVRLVRGSAEKDGQIHWDPTQPVSPEAVSGFDAVIHLAGESIVGRWTAGKKQAIRDSRVKGTSHLAAALAKATYKPQVFLCGSAIGYYGDRGDEVLNEQSAPGSGFLPEVCREWKLQPDRQSMPASAPSECEPAWCLARKAAHWEKCSHPSRWA